MSWPQTIADTNDPRTDFHKNLRAFLTIVGTEVGTDVTIRLSTDIVGSPDIPAASRGDEIEISLGPFDVVNLETGDFGADFTGTAIEVHGGGEGPAYLLARTGDVTGVPRDQVLPD